jgi:hypothetical protein
MPVRRRRNELAKDIKYDPLPPDAPLIVIESWEYLGALPAKVVQGTVSAQSV